MLEKRVLLSITAATALGPGTTAGTTWSYETTGPSQSGTDTSTTTVIGQVMFNGVETTDVRAVDTTTSTDNPPVVDTTSSDIYIGLSEDSGYTVYGSSTDGGTVYYSPTNSSSTEFFPPSLSAGVPVTTNVTLTGTFTNSSGGSQTNVATLQTTYTLVSDTTTPITVPAGTYNCYQIDETSITTPQTGDSAGVAGTPDVSQLYSAKGVGEVEDIDGSGDSESTDSLTAFSTSAALEFDVQPTDALPGAAIAPAIAVEVHGSDGQLDTQANDQLTLAITDNTTGATLNGKVTVQTIGGVATFNGISIDKPGDYTLTATGSNGEIEAESDPFSIGGDHLVFSKQPVDAGINAEIPTTVEVEDDNSDIVTTATGQVELSLNTITGGKNAVLGGTITATLAGGVATFSGTEAPTINVGGTYTLTATLEDDSTGTPVADESTGTGTSDKFDVALEHLVLTKQPGNVDSKAPIALTVEVKDAENKVDTDYTDKVQATLNIQSGGENATLAGTTLLSFVNGVATFSGASAPTIADAGSYTLTLTAVDPDTSEAVSSTAAVTTKAFKVAGNKLVILKQPTEVDAGSPIPLEIELRDASNKVDTSDSSDGVTVTFDTVSGGSGAKLTGTTTATFIGGIALFGNAQALAIDTPGTYTLTITENPADPDDDVPAAVTTKAFKVVGFHLVFKKQPTAGDVDTDLPFVVALEDASNKIDTTDHSDSAFVSIEDAKTGDDLNAVGGGILSEPFVNGLATFPATDGFTIDTPGDYKISVTDVDTATLATTPSVDVGVSNAFKIAGFHLVFKPQPKQTDVNTPVVFTVLLEDSKNKLATDDAVTQAQISLNAVKGGDESGFTGTTDVTFSGGVAAYTADQDLEIDTPGTYSLTATEMQNDPDTGELAPVTTTTDATSSDFEVKGFHLVFTAQPANGDISTPTLFKVQVEDSQNKVDTNDSGSTVDIDLNTIKGGIDAELTGTTSLTITNGVADFTAAQDVEIDSPGTYTLTATEQALDADTGDVTPVTTTTDATSKNFTLTGYHLVFKQSPANASVDTSIPMTVVLEDSKNKIVTDPMTDNSPSVTVTLNPAETGSAAMLTGDTAVGLLNGTATFPDSNGVAIDTPGKYTITATDTFVDPDTGEVTQDSQVTQVTSKTFTVAGLHLAFTANPANADADATIPFTISLENAQNKVDTTDSTTEVQVDLNTVKGGENASLNGTTTMTFVDGVAQFPATDGVSVDAPGTFTLTATAVSPDPDTGELTPVTTTTAATSKSFVVAGYHLVFVEEPADQTVDQEIPFTVAVEDSKNQVDTNDNGDSVTLTLNTTKGGSGAQLGGSTTVALVAGHAIFPDTTGGIFINSIGTYTLTASSVGPDAATGAIVPVFNVDDATSKSFDVTGLHVVFSTQPVSAAADSLLTFTVEVEDDDNKIDTSDLGSDIRISLDTVTDGVGAELTGTSLITLVNGVATVTVANDLAISAAGKFTLTATQVTTDDTGALVDLPESTPGVSKVFSVTAIN